MSKINLKTTAAALAFVCACALASASSAQVVPANQADAPASATQPAVAPPGDEPGISSLNETVLVSGDPEDVAKRHFAPLPLRAMNQDDRVTKLSRKYWLAHGWTESDFEAMKAQNVGLCQKTGYFTFKFAALAEKYRSAAPRVAALAVRYDKMSGSIKRAGVFRIVADIATPIVGSIAFTPAYGAVMAPGSLGDIATTHVTTKQQLLSNDAGKLTNDLTDYSVDFNLTSLELYADYLEMMDGYCTSYHMKGAYGSSHVTAQAATPPY